MVYVPADKAQPCSNLTIHTNLSIYRIWQLQNSLCILRNRYFHFKIFIRRFKRRTYLTGYSRYGDSRLMQIGIIRCYTKCFISCIQGLYTTDITGNDNQRTTTPGMIYSSATETIGTDIPAFKQGGIERRFTIGAKRFCIRSIAYLPSPITKSASITYFSMYGLA